MSRVQTAKVARLMGPRELVWDEEALPDVSPTEVRARTLASAVSPGTEIAAFVGLPPLRPMKVYPRVVGYCNVAVVECAGANSGFSAGSIIVTHQSHRTAFVCDRDAVLAVAPEGSDPVRISAAYLFHLGLAAVQGVDFHSNPRLAIIGLGTLGLATSAVADKLGAEVDGYSNRDIALPASLKSARVRRKDDFAESAYDLVVSTSNSWADWLLALRLAGKGATIKVLGFPGRGEEPPEFNPLASEYLYDKQLTITACGSVARDRMKNNMQWLVDLIGRGELDASMVISAIQPACELSGVYQRLAARDNALTSVGLTW